MKLIFKQQMSKHLWEGYESKLENDNQKRTTSNKFVKMLSCLSCENSNCWQTDFFYLYLYDFLARDWIRSTFFPPAEINNYKKHNIYWGVGQWFKTFKRCNFYNS